MSKKKQFLIFKATMFKCTSIWNTSQQQQQQQQQEAQQQQLLLHS